LERVGIIFSAGVDGGGYQGTIVRMLDPQQFLDSNPGPVSRLDGRHHPERLTTWRTDTINPYFNEIKSIVEGTGTLLDHSTVASTFFCKSITHFLILLSAQSKMLNSLKAIVLKG